MDTANTPVPIKISEQGSDWKPLVEEFLGLGWENYGVIENWDIVQSYEEYVDIQHTYEFTVRHRNQSDCSGHSEIRVQATLDCTGRMLNMTAEQFCQTHTSIGCGVDAARWHDKALVERAVLYDMQRLVTWLNANILENTGHAGYFAVSEDITWLS